MEDLRSNILSQIHGKKCWPSVEKVSPCEDACPLRMDVPSYVLAIAQGRFAEALQIIRETNPFPSICGRVCHHPCETNCNRALLDEPVAISSLKRFVADGVLKNAPRPSSARPTEKEKVAVIGSGPAGLAAAYDLARKGYGVTVYEESAIPGGMLTSGIPEFILPREVVLAEIEMIKSSGVAIKTAVAVGRTISPEDLRKAGYQAILLATGAQKNISISIPGVELRNIHYALPLLRKVNGGHKISFPGRVLVIGGGAVAMDAARLVRRLGAEEVHVACLESREKMPAPDWLIAEAVREGVKMHTSLAAQKFTEDSRKGIRVEFQRVASTHTDADGRISWTLLEGPGSRLDMEFDSIILAVGQAPDPVFAVGLGVKAKERGTFIVDEDSLETTVPGVFAAGDAVSLRGTVVEAIAAGQKAARAIETYLKGGDPKRIPRPAVKEVIRIEPESAAPWLTRKARWMPPFLSPGDAVRTFGEAQLGYTRAMAVEEAKRCLNCRMCVNCLYGRSQVCFETGMRLL